MFPESRPVRRADGVRKCLLNPTRWKEVRRQASFEDTISSGVCHGFRVLRRSRLLCKCDLHFPFTGEKVRLGLVRGFLKVPLKVSEQKGTPIRPGTPIAPCRANTAEQSSSLRSPRGPAQHRFWWQRHILCGARGGPRTTAVAGAVRDPAHQPETPVRAACGVAWRGLADILGPPCAGTHRGRRGTAVPAEPVCPQGWRPASPLRRPTPAGPCEPEAAVSEASLRDTSVTFPRLWSERCASPVRVRLLRFVQPHRFPWCSS